MDQVVIKREVSQKTKPFTGFTTGDLISIGEQVKAISETDRYLTVGAYGLRYANPKEHDLTGEWFTRETDFGPFGGNGVVATFHHCQPVGEEPAVKALAQRVFRPVEAVQDDIGIFVKHVLDMADDYEAAVAELVKAGKLIWSSGTASHMVLKEEDSGEIKRWHILEWAYTPTPAEPRLPKIAPLKSVRFETISLNIPAGEQPDDPAKLDLSGAGAGKQAGSTFRSSCERKSVMNLLEKLKTLVPGMTDEQYTALAAALELAFAQPPTSEEVSVAEDAVVEDVSDPETMAVDEFGNPIPEDQEKEDEEEEEAPPIRSINVKKLAAALKAELGLGRHTATGRKAAVIRPAYDFKPKGEPVEDQASKTFNALYAMRFGEEDDAIKAVMTDLVGKNYRQVISDQNRSFAKFLRRGEMDLDRTERDLLRRQIFPVGEIRQMLDEGMDVSAIKATMVEAQGTLGGYAVPPNVQAEVTTRLPGLTAVRGLGGRVVTLTNSNAIEIPRYTGGDDRYVGNLRGQWGSETQAPTEQNASLDMVTVTANVYTFKVPMSQSLVEDAANLVQLVQQDIANTLAMDEDEAFLVGDGAGKPLGILPDSGNALGLTEVISGAAATLTADGLIALSEGIADQYMEESAFVFRRATATAIRQLKTGLGEYLFDRYMEGGRNIRTLLGFAYRRSEAMPVIGAGTYPIIFGNMQGYTIVERAGLTIARFQDSGTGINKVEYHVRRRIGGRVERPWMFAVQKVAAP